MPRFSTWVTSTLTSASVLDADDTTVVFEDGNAREATIAQILAPVGQQLILPAQQFTTVTGSAVLSASPANRLGGYLFDQTTVEAVASTLIIPSGWATATFSFVWANTAASAGNVVWIARFTTVAEGGDLNTSPGSSATITDAAGGQWIAQTGTTSSASVTAGLNRIEVERTASSGSDTLANDAALYAVILTRAS